MLIEIAGVDGSGKSTLINKLIGWANRANIPAYDWCIRSNTRRSIGSVSLAEDAEFSSKLSGDILEFAVSMDLIRIVNQAPASRLPGQVVFADNFIHGWLTNVSQSNTFILPEVTAIFRHLVRPPELAFEIEVTPNVSYERILQREKLDPSLQLGGIEYLDRRATAFRNTRTNCCYLINVIDGTKSPDMIFEEVLAQILSSIEICEPSLWNLLIKGRNKS